MKIKKRWLLIGAILILLTRIYILREYRFPHDAQSVAGIRIMHRVNQASGDPLEYVFLKELDKNEIPAFMEQIYALETQRGGTPPRWGYGEYMAEITYINGDMEYLGTHCIGFVPSGGRASGVGEYYFADEEAFLDLIRPYLPAS